jgi:NADP-dependent 3-hydroxy acid dehydrogenase YdfG
VTIVSPGGLESELQWGSSDAESAAGVKAFYDANQIPADSVAHAVVYAVEQPATVDINEIVPRPVTQDFRGTASVPRKGEAKPLRGIVVLPLCCATL